MSEAKWYYAVNNQQYGPLDESGMQQLVQDRQINAHTLVWYEGMTNWAPLQDTSLRAIVPVSAAPLVGPPPVAQYQAPQPVDANVFSQLFMWYWISLAASIPLAFIVIGIFTAFASVVLFYILLYRYWELIQDGTAQTTPGKAVGYCFIPFFNFYWMFTAIRGLAQDMNRYTRTRGIQAPIVDEQMANWYCILSICNVIPYLDFITGIASIILQIILLNNMTKAAVAIANWKKMQG
jgi:hypothetical protein